MTNDHNKHSNRTNGFYKTPNKTVEYIVKKVKPFIKPNNKILDPAVGDGVFLKKMIELGVKKEQIYCHDINPDIIQELKNEFPNILLKDSLLEDYEKVDIIVGNPPYNSNECDYIKKNRKLLKEKFELIGAINLYPIFIYAGIEKLKEDGILCMIVLDSFLTNIYYKPLREYILNNCKIVEILLAPWRLFHSQKADVRTAIITLQKCSGIENITNRNNNEMILIDRVANEDEYEEPTKKANIRQIEFCKMPDNIFFVGTLPKIVDLVKKHKTTIGHIAGGGTGISTGKDDQFLKHKSEVQSNSNWVGFFKSGKRNPYYYETDDYIERDWKKNAKLSKTFMIRNKDFFFREGITCSSVGLKFNASYMPADNLFGVNTNLFCKTHEDMFYLLGFLNSKVAYYIARQLINRTNNISARYIKMIPYLEPNKEIKIKICQIVEEIVKNMKENQNYDFSEKQKVLDELFFATYGINREEENKITDFCENIFERI